MSHDQNNEKFNLAGLNLKEWAFIILMVNLSIVIVSFAIVFWISISNNVDGITISGTIDLSQITTIVFGIALVATVLVSQKLTQNAVQTAVSATDKAWMESEKNG